MKGGVVASSNWIVPRNPVVVKKTTQDIQIVEVTGEVDPGVKTSSSYVVQLPSPECTEEIILTPPLAPEAPLRFSKRNISGMQDKVEDKAKKMASKRNLEGLQQGEDAVELRAGVEMIKTGTMQLMNMCGAAKQPIQGA